MIIVAFWSGATGWLISREILPHFRSGEPPPYTIDLTDEVSGQQIYWEILQKGQKEKVGTAVSSVHRMPDRTYEFRTRLTFSKAKLLNLADLKAMTSQYRVTGEGQLLRFQAGISARLLLDLDIQVLGIFQEDSLDFTVSVLGQETQKRFEAVKVPRNILNPMHLVNRVGGLRPGQDWSIPLLDTVSLAAKGGDLAGLDRLHANVESDELEWNGQRVTCYKIEYREPSSRKLKARTWVRRHDGLVLRQEAQHELLQLVLQRVPSR